MTTDCRAAPADDFAPVLAWLANTHAEAKAMRAQRDELLAALRNLLQQADEGVRACIGTDSGGTVDWKGSFHSRLEDARDAIAHAEETP